MHVMLDLETWGRESGCAIRSIGAVVFDPLTGDLGARFYRNIDDESSKALGLTFDPETVAWWADQSEAAQAALLEDQRPVGEAVADFASWFTEVGGVQIYGHGAIFDVGIVEGVFRACHVDTPWKFWNVRCCRTILAMANRRPMRLASDVHHNALNDAEAQARAVAAAFRAQQFNPN